MDKKDAAQPEPAAEAARPEPHSLAQTVDAWWEEHFPGSAVARSTEAWNHAFRAKEELKRLLRSKTLGLSAD
jgi:hypothetical protein